MLLLGKKRVHCLTIAMGFFQYTFELQWNLGGGSSKGAIRVEKNAAVKKHSHIHLSKYIYIFISQDKIMIHKSDITS